VIGRRISLTDSKLPAVTLSMTPKPLISVKLPRFFNDLLHSKWVLLVFSFMTDFGFAYSKGTSLSLGL
jgi:hypothetical protein